MDAERADVGVVGTVRSCHRHPVKSMQGLEVASLDVTRGGVTGDRSRAVISTADGTLLSAKHRPELLAATADDEGIVLPDGRALAFGDDGIDDTLSDWLGAEVRLGQPLPSGQATYRMTFDPPNDDAELIDIPALEGTFLDVAPVHLVTTATLDGCRRSRPDLDWDVRRFRPNLVLDVDGGPYVEDGWAGRRLAVGAEVVLHIDQPTVRCAMPLRAQPGLQRQVAMYRAMTDLNEAHPYHLGAYVSVERAGLIAVGDDARLLP